jgi:multiple sugar transport system substrate-binding protein
MRGQTFARVRLLSGVGFASLVLVGATPSFAEDLTFVWHAGTCADLVYQISKDYPDKSVNIVPDLVPYGPLWHDKIAANFAIHGDAFDFAMWDSQSTAEFAGGGHAYSVNKVFQDSPYLKANLFSPLSLKLYGEYPDDSGRFWGLPVNQDAYGMMYRKDLFENPKEKAAFKAKYGRELEVPQTYSDAKQVAEFFTRPVQGLYGWGQMGGRPYDFATSASNPFLWSYGGELWNPQTREVKGYLNSPASVQGVQAYVDMFKYGPSGSETWDWDAVNSAFQQGHLAMAMQWYYFDGSNSDPKVNPYAEKTGYGVTPGQVGLDGKFRREMMIGGQGIGLNVYSKKIPQTIKFLEWFYHPEQQKRWAAVCQTGLKSTLDSPEWQKVNTYNKSFANAMTHMHHDYWHLPEYPQLLDILQDEVTAASSGKKSVKEALDSAAERQEQLLEQAGYKITRTQNIPQVPNQIVDPVGMDQIVREKYD